MAKSIKNKEAKAKIKEFVSKLNAAGFSGGLYFYKGGECSCCYGGDKKAFFSINGNIPSNWGAYDSGSSYYKVSYKTENVKKATEFRNLANQLAVNLFGSAVKLAIDNHEAIIIDID